MMNTDNFACRSPEREMRALADVRWFSGWLIALLLLAAGPVQAQSPDDEYVRIFNVISEADSLHTKGQVEQARAKYEQAYKALNEFKRRFPTWNTKVVAFRSKYVGDKLQELARPAPPAAPDATAPPRETKPAAGAPGAQVKLVTAGTEPRNVLRLQPKTGDQQEAVLTMQMAMEMLVGEMGQPMKLPALKTTMALTVTGISDNGDITYNLTIADVEVSDEPGVMPQMADMMRSSMGTVKGRSINGILSNRGISKGTEAKIPAGADPQTRQYLDQLKESFSILTVVLPEEAVGIGGKWEAREALKSQGMTLDQTTTYELLSTEDGKLGLKIDVSQHAANQKIQTPAMPGMKVNLHKMTGKGVGNVAASLGQVLPSQASIDSHTEVSMSMSAAGQQQSMNMKTDVNLRLESK